MAFLFKLNNLYICANNQNNMLVKNIVLDSINNLPEKFSIDELMEKLIVLNRVQIGDKQSLENSVVNEAELDNEIEKWFK